MGKCVLAGFECPETSDPAKKWFCPLWKSGIPDVVDPVGFTSFPLFTGCFLRKIEAYGIATARDAAHSAAAFNEARNVVLGQNGSSGDSVAQLATMGLVLLGGAMRERRLPTGAQDENLLEAPVGGEESVTVPGE